MPRKPETAAVGSKIARRLALQQMRQIVGEHELALEYLFAQQILLGYNARSAVRNLGKTYPEMQGLLDDMGAGTVYDLLGRAMAEGLVEVKCPDRMDVANALQNAYKVLGCKNVQFHVADDSIGHRHAHSRSPFVWRLAAQVIWNCIERVARHKDVTGDVNIGNTGGPSIAAASEALGSFHIERDFLDDHAHRLWFLSLSGAGSARGFDEHANFIATRLSRACRAQHLAVVGNDPPGDDYRKRVENMHLIISGLGGQTSYLSEWLDRHNMPRPEGMIGDIFLNPIDENGDLLELPRQIRDALMLRPTHAELRRLLSRSKPPFHTLIIVQERRRPDGNPFQDKTRVLDAVIRRGYVHDCVLGSSLAIRLLKHLGLETGELERPQTPLKPRKGSGKVTQKQQKPAARPPTSRAP